MVQDSTTYYVWIGGSCDYGHKERAGGAAVVIEHDGSIISRDVISDLHTTEFRMMLTLMVKVMNELPDGSDILFLTNAAYIQNFDKTPTAKSANPDLISQCIEAKTRHSSVSVKIVPYHKSPLLIETHDMATEAMAKTRKEYHHDIQCAGIVCHDARIRLQSWPLHHRLTNTLARQTCDKRHAGISLRGTAFRRSFHQGNRKDMRDIPS